MHFCAIRCSPRYFNPRSSYEERRRDLSAYVHLLRDFNPRSSYEERPAFVLYFQVRHNISIHAPHTRSDRYHESYGWTVKISIHAPHTRSDTRSFRHHQTAAHFNPRSSYEERRVGAPSVERFREISIHAPHTRSDERGADQMYWGLIFQSTLLIRGATSRPH